MRSYKNNEVPCSRPQGILKAKLLRSRILTLLCPSTRNRWSGSSSLKLRRNSFETLVKDSLATVLLLPFSPRSMKESFEEAEKSAGYSAKKNKKGVSIIAAVVIMLLVAVMAATIVSLLGTNTMNSVNYMQSQQAFYLAESGIQRGLLALSKSDWTGWSGTDPKTIQATLSGYGDYDVSVADPTSNAPEITATGYIPSRTATQQAKRVTHVEAIKSNLFGQYAMFGGGSGGGSSIGVNLTGGAYTDSYDASVGRYNVDGNIGQNGDVGTNADIRLSGGAYIGGDAFTGPVGVFSDQAAVAGSITHDTQVNLSPVVVPSSLTGLSSSGEVKATTSIASGNYKYTKFNLASSDAVTITGPANIYLTDNNSIKMVGSSQIIISAASTGPVVIYAAGDVSVAGQGITNSTYLPSNFQLYGAGGSGQSIRLTGGSELYGAIYAPNGNLTISGIADLYGSFIGDTMTMTGSSGLHLDTSLGSLVGLPSFVPGIYMPSDWKEIY